MAKNLIILGPPGSGKGTQAKILAEKFNFLYFGTGELMREEARKGTLLGQKFQAVWDRGQGELVSDDLVEALVSEKLKEIDLNQGVIFDGYPRTLKQAKDLKNLIVLNIQVPKDELLERLASRRICEHCGQIFFQAEQNGLKICDQCGGALLQRQEDKPETMLKRIEVYENQTKPLIDYFKNYGTLINIDGRPAIAIVTQEIEEKLQKILNENRRIKLKTKKEIAQMRLGGKIASRILKMLGKSLKAGLTTGQIDQMAEVLIEKAGAQPSFKDYHGYPGNICVSINDEVVHGIAGRRLIKNGDLVSLDIGIFFQGFHTDTAATFGVGKVSLEAKKLLDVTRQSLDLGIKTCVAGRFLGDVQFIIQKTIENAGFSVIRNLAGHGVGRALQEPPSISNYGRPATGPKLQEGMTLALEPMVSAGDWQVKTLADGWTVVTCDKSLSAHFEHTIAITKTDAEVLTK